MRGFDHATITQRFLVPVATVSTRNAWHNDLLFVTQNWDQEFRGVLPGKLGGGVQHASWNPYSISDQNLWFSPPYFRPNQTFDTLFQTWSPGATWPERVTSCYGTYTVVGVNIKGEMVLSPNDEEVANSSKKHIQFKCRVHKPHPISDLILDTLFQTKAAENHTLWRRTYPYGLYKGLPPPPPGRKTLCRLWVSLLTQARLKNL